jgi:hypothetical protein
MGKGLEEVVLWWRQRKVEAKKGRGKEGAIPMAKRALVGCEMTCANHVTHQALRRKLK